MQDQATAAFLSTLGLSDRAATLPSIFQAGERIAETDPGSVPDGMQVQRIAVLGSVTIDYLSHAVAYAVAQEGVFPVIHQAPYGSYVQQILEPGSDLYRFGPALVVIAPHWRDLVAALSVGSQTDTVQAVLQDKVALLRGLWTRLAESGIKIIQQLPLPPPHRYRGIAERFVPASPANQIERINAMLLEAGHGLVTWVDMAAVADRTGTRRFAAPKFYYTAKLEFDPKFLPDYLPAFRAAWRSATGRAKKVLVLDLDNTLWGGVIGDDGVEGIQLGPATPAGEAFEAWQHYVKALGERGVVLAVCSKNDPAVAESGFSHPNAALRRTDFSAFACSWNDKATGLRGIAEELNLGLDSFVFCDDNPAECELVRRELPEVCVICLDADPSGFIDVFDAGHWFDTDLYTQEDLSRSKAYAAREAFRSEQASATDIGRYLAGLTMKGALSCPTESEIGRVAQLELKTNQFNVTTRRYTEAQIRGFLDRADAVVLAFRLSDCFGEHGLTATLIAMLEGDTLRIDSWLMSCRIFSRTAEAFILRGLVPIARSLGAKWLRGEYRATPKNRIVEGLYPSLGFTPEDDGFYRRPTQAPTDDLVTYITG